VEVTATPLYVRHNTNKCPAGRVETGKRQGKGRWERQMCGRRRMAGRKKRKKQTLKGTEYGKLVNSTAVIKTWSHL